MQRSRLAVHAMRPAALQLGRECTYHRSMVYWMCFLPVGMSSNSSADQQSARRSTLQVNCPMRTPEAA